MVRSPRGLVLAGPDGRSGHCQPRVCALRTPRPAVRYAGGTGTGTGMGTGPGPAAAEGISGAAAGGRFAHVTLLPVCATP
ncbi:hypothetical protein JCM4814A_82510 [Streptomyces phaeofaciens JCM 4814]|uniref:Uncharacterized protein n=1 Tax=Streptomyces phaeofaciens TaxID=68254 RepID=A0A918HPW0_9ACTN|nr:hypothetical protein GCM10010226_80510 [Streptomyces phaeofaciens]